MSEMLELIIDDVNDKAKEIMSSLKKHLAKVRTGRASVSLLDDVRADYYGQITPLRQMANISVPEPRLLVVQPFDPAFLKEIEKAIVAADLGLNPQNDGKVLRVVIPELTPPGPRNWFKIAAGFDLVTSEAATNGSAGTGGGESAPANRCTSR